MEVNNKKILIYFSVLLVVLLSWTSDVAFPPMIFRIIFLALVLGPFLLGRIDKGLLTGVFYLFTTISFNYYAKSYMPGADFYWVYIIIFAIIASYSRIKNSYSTQKTLLVFAFFTCVSSLLHGEGIATAFLSSIIIYLLGLSVDVSNTKSRDYLSWSFVLVSLIFSVLFFFVADRFASDYNEFTRYGWRDPNYFGMIIGFGEVISVYLLLNKKDVSRLIKYILIITIFLSTVVLLALASRGAVLCVACSSVILILFSKISSSKKVLFIICAASVLFIMYNSNAMDLLIYRINEDDGSGSGRTGIWASKLYSFSNGSILNQLFGFGYEGALSMGQGYAVGFHNDYLSILCSFGILGAIPFMYILLKLLISSLKPSINPLLLSVTLFIIICCISLEPYSGGSLPYFFFILYAQLLTFYEKR